MAHVSQETQVHASTTHDSNNLIIVQVSIDRRMRGKLLNMNIVKYYTEVKMDEPQLAMLGNMAES